MRSSIKPTGRSTATTCNFITGRRQEELDAAVKGIGGKVSGVRADTSKLADIDRLYDAVQQKHSQIDVMFTNAGGGSMLPLGAITEEQYRSAASRTRTRPPRRLPFWLAMTRASWSALSSSSTAARRKSEASRRVSVCARRSRLGASISDLLISGRFQGLRAETSL
jgi:hypothetical protein